MRVIMVTGGRNYADTKAVDRMLSEWVKPDDVIVHGGCTGADELCEQWAKANGVHTLVCAALWEKHGKAAGPIRNRVMLSLGPALVIAFPGGNGTRDVIRQAQQGGFATLICDPATELAGDEP